jgi:hypothetical protein
MMRFYGLTFIAIALTQPVLSQPMQDIFRPVSFICRDGATGTSVKIEENVLGHRKLYEVSYFEGKPTLFVISQSSNGRMFKRVGLIDLRSEQDPANLEAAEYLGSVMAQDSSRFCKGSRRNVLAARYQLLANHSLNRSHPLYRGK